MRRTVLSLLAIGLAACGAGYFYYVRSIRIPSFPARRATFAAAKLQAAPPAAAPSANSLSDVAPKEAQSVEGKIPPVRLVPPEDPMEPYHRHLNGAILRDLGPAFPALAELLKESSDESSDPAYRRTTLQLLDAAEKEPVEKRAIYWLAADGVAQGIWCAMEEKTKCGQLRDELQPYDLTLSGDGLGGVFVYSHDLLWRVWQDFPKTEWGERAFVLLLERGWDTSPTCEKGAEQFREMIRRGEEFLAERPSSPQREPVMLLVAQAYATWWSLSKEPLSGMSDYVDPKQYQPGAEEAREKAIRYFDRIAEAGAEEKAKEYAGKVATILRNREPLIDYKFYCVYD